MLRQLLAQANGRLQLFTALHFRLQIGKLQFTFAHQIADAVQRHAAIVANNTSAPVSIRQTGEHAGFTATHHLRRVDVEHALVMGFAQMGEDILELRVHLASVGFKRAADHVDPAIRMQGAFQRTIRLQADDRFQLFLNIARPVSGNGGRDVGVEINGSVSGVFVTNALHYLLPQRRGGWRGRR
ncbi:hypothetical protein D3C71_1553220 [compost metagenome]